MKIRTSLYILSLILVVGLTAQGQSALPENEASPFRNFLGKFIVSGSMGYGVTFNSHELQSWALVQNPGNSPYIIDNDFQLPIPPSPIPKGYTDWVTGVKTVDNIPNNPPSTFLLGMDSANVKFKSRSHSVPINLSVHYTFDRYRIGVGYSFEPYFVGTYSPTTFKENINSFKTEFSSSVYHRWFLLLGGEVLKTKRHIIAIDAKVGSYSLSKKKFNHDQIKKGVFFNLGVRLERSISEYVQVYIRPSFEFKSYSLIFPESGYEVVHSLPAFYTNVGLTWRLPARKKCRIKTCQTQVHHHHGRKNYRSRVHPFYKWQNPDYGQNYPQLVKYKRKNKKKLNAY